MAWSWRSNRRLPLQNRMYTELLQRYIAGIKRMEIKSTLDFAACPVPGSYAADVRATVKMQSGETKNFSIIYLKRYDQAQLDAAMHKEGWIPVEHWRYAEEYHPRLLLLYQRARQISDDS